MKRQTIPKGNKMKRQSMVQNTKHKFKDWTTPTSQKQTMVKSCAPKG
jgi:hypothetical protein